MRINLFKHLADYFATHGHCLYMVGGTSRDYLLGHLLTDLDFATDASPEELKQLFIDQKTPFIHLGSISVKFLGRKVDITCLRKESNYIDYRHPQNIEFIKSIKEDSLRRDFTINAIYIDKELNVYDFHHGQEDLSNKLIRIIGDGDIRFKEDPLRILRAIRFALTFNFEIESKTSESMKRHVCLLSKLTKEKVLIEINKMKKINFVRYRQMLKEYSINENDFMTTL